MAEQGKGNTGEALMSLLERRLDNVVHRLGFGQSPGPGPAADCATATSRSTAAASIFPATWSRPGDVIRVKNRAKSLQAGRRRTGRDAAATCPISSAASTARSPEGHVGRLPEAADVSIPVQTALDRRALLASSVSARVGRPGSLTEA